MMKKKITRYGPITPQSDPLEFDGRPIHIDVHNHKIYLWAEQHEGEKPTRLKGAIKLIATGHTYDDHWTYFKTLKDSLGYVWHSIIDYKEREENV